jgi:hypothetical protein
MARATESARPLTSRAVPLGLGPWAALAQAAAFSAAYLGPSGQAAASESSVALA